MDVSQVLPAETEVVRTDDFVTASALLATGRFALLVAEGVAARPFLVDVAHARPATRRVWLAAPELLDSSERELTVLPISSDPAALRATLAAQLELVVASERLVRQDERLTQMALRDSLTGLYNHRAFQERLREEMARALRQNTPLSLVLCDLDHFQRYNELLGHDGGDALMTRVAALLTGSSPLGEARRTDIAARFGGEEFALALPETTKDGATVLAERLRASIETEALGSRAPLPALTVSFGVAGYPEDASTPQELLLRADEALREAKEGGRNRVVTWMRADSPVRLVRTFHQVHGELAGHLRRERSLFLVTLQLTDLPRFERHYGKSATAHLRDAFALTALEKARGVLAASRLLAVAAPEPGSVELFISSPGMLTRGAGDALERLAVLLAESVERALQVRMSRAGTGLVRVAGGYGAQLFSGALSTEHQLEALRQTAERQCMGARLSRMGRDKLALQRVLLGDQIQPLLQPIFADAGRRLIGYEALSRGPRGSTLESPLSLLDLAEDLDLLTAIDLCMLRASLAASSGAPEDCFVFVNVMPGTLADALAGMEDVPRLALDSGIPARRLVFELSEREPIETQGSLMTTLAHLRSLGFAIALDDLGTENANLAEIAALHPEWLKLDRRMVHGLDADPVKRHLIAAIVHFGREQGAHILAEGVETPAELEVLHALGVECFQGYLLGMPQPAPESWRRAPRADGAA